MYPITNDDVLSYTEIVENLEKPSSETDAIIFQHLLYPNWFRSKSLSNTLVDSDKLINGKYISSHTKVIPSLTKSFDKVFETFSEKIMESKKFQVERLTKGHPLSNGTDEVRYMCTLHTTRGFGFNPACAVLSAVIQTYLQKI